MQKTTWSKTPWKTKSNAKKKKTADANANNKQTKPNQTKRCEVNKHQKKKLTHNATYTQKKTQHFLPPAAPWWKASWPWGTVRTRWGSRPCPRRRRRHRPCRRFGSRSRARSSRGGPVLFIYFLPFFERQNRNTSLKYVRIYIWFIAVLGATKRQNQHLNYVLYIWYVNGVRS